MVELYSVNTLFRHEAADLLLQLEAIGTVEGALLEAERLQIDTSKQSIRNLLEEITDIGTVELQEETGWMIYFLREEDLDPEPEKDEKIIRMLVDLWSGEIIAQRIHITHLGDHERVIQVLNIQITDCRDCQHSHCVKTEGVYYEADRLLGGFIGIISQENSYLAFDRQENPIPFELWLKIISPREKRDMYEPFDLKFGTLSPDMTGNIFDSHNNGYLADELVPPHVPYGYSHVEKNCYECDEMDKYEEENLFGDSVEIALAGEEYFSAPKRKTPEEKWGYGREFPRIVPGNRQSPKVLQTRRLRKRRLHHRYGNPQQALIALGLFNTAVS